MKIRLSGLSVGLCFTRGKSKVIKKKVAEDKVATRGKNGKFRTRTQRGDPEVEQAGCPITHIGIGGRRHPDEALELGDGRPKIRGVRPLHGR